MRNLIWLAAALMAPGAFSVCAQEVETAMVSFKPTCIEAVLSSKEVRPGGQIAVTLRFRNDGTAASAADYMVFVHVEFQEKSCGKIVFQADHMPTVPTTAWDPGRVIADGAHVLDFPADAPEGTYHLHVGVYSHSAAGLPRLSDQYVAEIKVSRTAPEASPIPPEMDPAEAARRRAALARRIEEAVTIENDRLAFTISPSRGTWSLLDKSTGEVWHSNAEEERLAEVRFTDGERMITKSANVFSDVRQDAGRIALTYTPDLPGPAPSILFTVELVPGKKGARFSYSEVPGAESSTRDAQEWRVETVRLLDKALWATDAEQGYLAIPHRMGILFPADEGLPSVARYSAYSNYRSYSMSMLGIVKNDSALLVHWDDPYAVLEVQRSWPDLPHVPGHGMVSASLVLSKSAKSFVVSPLGKGGYVEIARAYREVARERGLLRTWRDKIRENPGVERMLGAADFKPFVFSRVVPNSRFNSSPEERVSVGYTFEEAARVAEHFKHDLEIDRAMFVLAGWIRRGYDNQHPDILPAAPECGGDEALADCARRVKKLGYLFGLHDNYQDMYKDAPSWDESLIMKHPDGSLYLGGEWAGGQAYLTCSRKALELARREQNLPAVKKLFEPTIYFIDTTFAAPPFECHDPEHPLTLSDDICWKRNLSEYARETFGLFGSEEGQEWAVPCADYFEGLMSHKTQPTGREIVIPLFEMVYGDCISLYTHQGDRATIDRPEYILAHILYAEMPVYHFGPHLYFKEEPESQVQVKPSVRSVKQVGPRKFEITYAWSVKSAPKADYGCFVHFTQEGSGRPEAIVFQNDHALKMSSWKTGETVVDGPYTVEIPKGASGAFEILIGLLEGDRRVPILGPECGNLRYHIGTLYLNQGKVLFDHSSEAMGNRFVFARRDEQTGLSPTDRLIKNTYEILSPLNRITARTPMTNHRFLTEDRTVEQTRFGDVTITVNYGEHAYHTGSAELPQYGFLVQSPCFEACYATVYESLKLSEPTMLVARSLDGKPLAESGNIKIYRAFGDRRLNLSGPKVRHWCRRDFTSP